MRPRAIVLTYVLFTVGCRDDQDDGSMGWLSDASAAAEAEDAATRKDAVPLASRPDSALDASSYGRTEIDARVAAQVERGLITPHEAPPSSDGRMVAPGRLLDAATIDPDAAVDAGSLPALPDGGVLDGEIAPLDTAPSVDAGPPSDEQLGAALTAHLRACKVLGDGRYDPRPIADEYGRCTARCKLEASCSALVATSCTASKDFALRICTTNCANLPFADGIQCGGAPVRQQWVCDGNADCPDKSDETGCASFSCRDGSVIEASFVACDGRKDCADGSDEEGCASYCASVL